MNLLSKLLGKPQAFALDISDTTLQIMEISGGNKGRITSFAHLDIPPGLMENGRILNQEKLAEVIKRALATAKPRPPHEKKIVTAIPESQVFTHHFALDKNIKKEELRKIALQKAGETLPIKLENYIWDIQIMKYNSEKLEVLFAAAEKELVKTYKHTLLLAGVDIAILEPESFALARATINAAKLPPDAIYSILDMGGRSTTLIFINNKGLQLSSSIPIAGNALTQALAKSKSIATDEAEKLKREKGFTDPQTAPQLNAVLAPLFDQFRQAVSFVENKTGGKTKKILLAGGSSTLPGLPEILNKTLNLEISAAKPPYEVSGYKPSQLAVVSGLALRAKTLSTGLNLIKLA
ncbi:MAG: type IV pilus assembly protein PilM [Patescibacteria group bacterium]|nr:type IV pilus assembly protein PilM [Patescibacteria group bacterium]MBU1034566.1 type IV pilus assembly protein PilM [Patescibacteria group bacterium]